MTKWKERVRKLKIETYALYLAYKDPRTPWYAKLVAVVVVAYAFSPIDLIPDFIPVLGYLDDLILLPLGILLAIKLVPKDVIEASRLEASRVIVESKPASRVAAGIIISIWALLLLMTAFLIWKAVKK